MRNILVLAIGFSLALTSCSSIRELTSESQVRARVIQYGLIDGIPEGLKYKDGNDVYCESSAVTKVGDRLLVASDKPMPGEETSPVFSFPVAKKFPAVITNVRPEKASLFQKSIKIEAMTYSPQTDLHFAATAFDRIKRDSREWDYYNMLFYWSGETYEDAKVLLKSEEEGVVSSKNIRTALERTVRSMKYPGGVSYYKVEGLAVLPNNQIVFGIREMGRRYDDFDYAFMLLSTSFIKTREGIIIDPGWTKIYEFDPAKHPGMNREMGLSSLEYHAESNSLIALTTYEKEGEPYETYIWALPLQKRLQNSVKPVLVSDETGKPFKMPYKGEGFIFLNKDTLFVIFDEDRTLSNVPTEVGNMTRKPHQGVFGVVKLQF